MDLNGEKIVATFYEKELQKTNQKEFRIEKRKGNKLHVKWKCDDIYSIVGLIKSALFKMSQYFFMPHTSCEGNVKVELDLSSSPTKLDLKNRS